MLRKCLSHYNAIILTDGDPSMAVFCFVQDILSLKKITEI